MAGPVKLSELFDLTGKVALVTGGGSGIGRQMAQGLAEAGADIVLCARKGERCEQAAEELRAELGVRALGLRCDVREKEEIDEVVRRTVDTLGRVDVLVNNAGTSWGASPETVPLEGWQKVIDVNLTGAFEFTQTVGRVLIEQGEGGAIVNVASIAAFRGAVPEVMNAIPYNTSKGALVALTVDLAARWARYGIRVNAIAPGWFPSDMTAEVLRQSRTALLGRVPLGRLGGPDDLKGAVVYLASAASGYVSGHTLVVDGGLLSG